METAQARVKQIRTAVDDAIDVLLMDEPYDESKVQMLRDMGFTASENVKDFEDHKLNNKFAQLYGAKYPFYKFITQHQLDKVRKKFKLIEGRLDQFKGNIPAKNIKEMVNFKIMVGDIDIAAIQEREHIGNAMNELHQQLFKAMGVPNIVVEVYRDRKSAPNFKRKDNAYQQPLPELTGNERVDFGFISKRFPEALRITADRELFDLPDPELDPIVTVKVKGGYLVVTAWGEEASDPDIANQRMN